MMSCGSMGSWCTPRRCCRIRRSSDVNILSRVPQTIAVGTFVLQWITAPDSRIILTISESIFWGSLHQATNPTVVSISLMLKLSLSDTGRPCSGPTGLPEDEYSSSIFFARSMASSKRISVRQFVYSSVLSTFRHRPHSQAVVR